MNFKGWTLILAGVCATSCCVSQDKTRSIESMTKSDGMIEEIRMVSARVNDEARRIADLETRSIQPAGHVIPTEFVGKSLETYGEEQEWHALAEAIVLLDGRLQELKDRRLQLESVRFKIEDPAGR